MHLVATQYLLCHCLLLRGSVHSELSIDFGKQETTQIKASYVLYLLRQIHICICTCVFEGLADVLYLYLSFVFVFVFVLTCILKDQLWLVINVIAVITHFHWHRHQSSPVTDKYCLLFVKHSWLASITELILRRGRKQFTDIFHQNCEQNKFLDDKHLAFVCWENLRGNSFPIVGVVTVAFNIGPPAIQMAAVEKSHSQFCEMQYFSQLLHIHSNMVQIQKTCHSNTHFN